jgi:hypothetical protein
MYRDPMCDLRQILGNALRMQHIGVGCFVPEPTTSYADCEMMASLICMTRAT